jgi:nifR3 family TIM-barrel protein
MLKIGPLEIPSRCLLAPLSGVSDLPFRMLNRSFGCEFAFLEMVSAMALNWKRKQGSRKFITCESDKPLGVQLLGSDLPSIQTAMGILLEKYKFDIIDLNAACPINKVARRGEGAGLLRNPQQLFEILKVMSAMSPVPVTVKIRTGWDAKSVNARDIALGAQDAGIKALFIHGRTRDQQYSGTVDYQTIREVKKALTIPVIASGDALSAQLVKKMFEETGCDGVAIARGALGNPWIFREIVPFLENNSIVPRPSSEEVTQVMIKHLDAVIEHYGWKIGILVFRKFFHWYAKNHKGIKKLRSKVCLATTREHVLELIYELQELELQTPIPV